ncbi:MAG: hypothetical protein AB7G11_02400 [Phycisphaerales bacterium]
MTHRDRQLQNAQQRVAATVNARLSQTRIRVTSSATRGPYIVTVESLDRARLDVVIREVLAGLNEPMFLPR